MKLFRNIKNESKIYLCTETVEVTTALSTMEQTTITTAQTTTSMVEATSSTVEATSSTVEATTSTLQNASPTTPSQNATSTISADQATTTASQTASIMSVALPNFSTTPLSALHTAANQSDEFDSTGTTLSSHAFSAKSDFAILQNMSTPQISVTTAFESSNHISTSRLQFSTNTFEASSTVNCCCRCCTPSDPNSCKSCSNMTINNAALCALDIPNANPQQIIQGKTTETTQQDTYLRNVSPNFEAASSLSDSLYQRLAYTEPFVKTQSFIEAIASLPVDVKVNLGSVAGELILECAFNGHMCSPET